MKKLVKSAVEKMWDDIMRLTEGSGIVRNQAPDFVTDMGDSVWLCHIGDSQTICCWCEVSGGNCFMLSGDGFEDIKNNINLVRALEAYKQKDNIEIANFLLLSEKDVCDQNESSEYICWEKCPWSMQEIFEAWYYAGTYDNEYDEFSLCLKQFFIRYDFEDEYVEIAEEEKHQCYGSIGSDVDAYNVVIQSMRNDLIEKIGAWWENFEGEKLELRLAGWKSDYFDDYVIIGSPYLAAFDNYLSVCVNSDDLMASTIESLPIDELLCIWTELSQTEH